MKNTTQTPAQHTPTPWHIGMKPGPIIYGPQGEQVAPLCVPMLPEFENTANAQFIVQACNAHAGLVEAVTDAEACLGDALSFIEAGQTADAIETLVNAQNRARAILATLEA